RSFGQIDRHLHQSSLSKGIRQKAIEIFKRLARAEASAHGKPVGRTRLHEVGEVDTLIDVVGAVAGLSLLGIDCVYASPIHVGAAQMKKHDTGFPIPAPATANLLKGCPIYATGTPGELTTPTGAAIITTLSSGFVPLPPMKAKKIGSGAGSNDYATPNLLRLFIGVQQDSFSEDEIIRIETNIDDMNPQLYEVVVDTLFQAGALDVYLTPVIMKKGRPAILITVLSPPALSDKIVNILFAETTTLGVRIQKISRQKLKRKTKKEETEYGSLHVKTAFKNGQPIRRRPEFRDVKGLAKKKGRPLRSLLEEINRAL
ncbi:MAG: nickel pincer cofactor biosynthesis protein LarC, partial [Nitrospiria bacterium]